MSGVLKDIPEKEKAASDAQRVRRARTLVDQRQEARNKDLAPRTSPDLCSTITLLSVVFSGVIWDWREVEAVAPVSDEDPEVPSIHPALGRWAENSAPNIHWDLANPEVWTYKRPFTEEELESSPFQPQQEKMTIVLCPEKGWVIDLKPRPGRPFLTLRCFQEAMAISMKQGVSRALWCLASVQRKFSIALAYSRRTGNLSIFPGTDIFQEWGKYLHQHNDNPDVAWNVLTQVNRYVRRGAPHGMTQLKTIDLLGENTVFAGLTYLKEKDLWIMSTVSRHNASGPHHLHPEPSPQPVAQQPILPPGAPPILPYPAQSMVPMTGPPMLTHPLAGTLIAPLPVARPAHYIPCPLLNPTNAQTEPAPQTVQFVPHPIQPVPLYMVPQYFWCGSHVHRIA